MRPLLPDAVKDSDIEGILKKSKRELLRRIKAKLTQATFSKRAKVALAKSLQIEVKPSSLVVTTDHPAFRPLTEGQKPGQMKWLLKAKRPIPIVTDEGKLIFRSATSKSMENGHWIHPGRPSDDFVEKAKKESRKFLKQKFEKELRKKIAASVTK